jgi:hypothetical protein
LQRPPPQTGVNRSTLFRAYKSGRMSATRADTGQIEVDPAELFRVFPPVAPQPGAQGETHHRAQASWPSASPSSKSRWPRKDSNP